MEEILTALAVLAAVGLGVLIGRIWANKKNEPNQLPSGPLKVISINNKSVILEEQNPRKKRFIISKRTLIGQAIKENDIVQRIKKDKKKYREFTITNCPRLIKVIEQ